MNEPMDNPCTCDTKDKGCTSCPSVLNEDSKNAVARLHKQLVDIAFDEDLDIITTPAGMDHDEVENLAFAYQQYLREIRATLVDPGWLAVL